MTAALLNAGQMDGRTDITKLKGVYRSYKNTPKMVLKESGGQENQKINIRVGFVSDSCKHAS